MKRKKKEERNNNFCSLIYYNNVILITMYQPWNKHKYNIYNNEIFVVFDYKVLD